MPGGLEYHRIPSRNLDHLLFDFKALLYKFLPVFVQ